MSRLVQGFITAILVGVTSIPAAAQTAAAQTTKEEFVPFSGQPGKDVVWVPSPEETVAKMMEVGKITAQDFVVDLGSGDGRNVIAAAKLGARALGVEYNNDMVELSRRLATKEGVAQRAEFVQGDRYQADFTKATVLALFLLPQNLQVLRDKIYNMQPGTRVVLNTFLIPDWLPDEQTTLDNCTTGWCTVYLNIVPAKIAGKWRAASPAGELTLTQEFQMVSGTFTTSAGQSIPVKGRLRGNDLTITTETGEFTGRVNGNTIEGTQRPTGGGAPQQITLTRVN